MTVRPRPEVSRHSAGQRVTGAAFSDGSLCLGELKEAQEETRQKGRGPEVRAKAPSFRLMLLPSIFRPALQIDTYYALHWRTEKREAKQEEELSPKCSQSGARIRFIFSDSGDGAVNSGDCVPESGVTVAAPCRDPEQRGGREPLPPASHPHHPPLPAPRGSVAVF